MVMREACPIEHILITLDGSTLAERALEPGLEVAQRPGARVTLLQVATLTLAPSELIYQAAYIERQVGHFPQSGVVDHAALYLDAMKQRLERRNVPVATEILEGFAAQSIVDYSETHGADLIVMATHGRTGLRRWAYGSVTEKLLRSGQCAMLVVRPGIEELKVT